jgi:hypothetical protein
MSIAPHDPSVASADSSAAFRTSTDANRSDQTHNQKHRRAG